MKPLRIFGIDPGFDRLGVAIIDKHGQLEDLVFSDCLLSSKKDSLSARMMFLANQLEHIIIRHKPNHIAIETLFVTKNQKTAMRVAEMRGIILYICNKHNIEVFEYQPAQVKMAITGFGRSDKRDIAFMVAKILRLDKGRKRLDDELDAIAIALTHSAHFKTYLGKTLSR